MIIKSSADKVKTNMDLTTLKNSAEGRLLKCDVKIANNFLSKIWNKRFERLVECYFNCIEDLIDCGNAFIMQEFIACADEFMSFKTTHKVKVTDTN